MTVHVLDTGALYLLHNKHKPSLLTELRGEASKGFGVWIPSIVLAEAAQSRRLEAKKLEMIYEIADVADITEDVAHHASDGLRAVSRTKCIGKGCSGYIGPSLVDAVVMAFAARYVTTDPDTYVHTSDGGEMEQLRAARFPGVIVRAC